MAWNGPMNMPKRSAPRDTVFAFELFMRPVLRLRSNDRATDALWQPALAAHHTEAPAGRTQTETARHFWNVQADGPEREPPKWQTGCQFIEIEHCGLNLAVPRGLEPPTFGLGNRCSIRLSYGTEWRIFVSGYFPGTNFRSLNIPSYSITGCPYAGNPH